MRFSRDVVNGGTTSIVDNIKISRGEENIFIWCFFLAIVQLAMDDDGTGPYKWVKNIYIDDPISSLDEHNAIVVANHLVQLFRETPNRLKTVISTHHILFFNVLSNEIKNLLNTRDSPQYCPVACSSEGQNVLFRGQSGVGKTMLAQNLALRAIEQGHTVRFTTFAAALLDLLKQESLPTVERRLRRYTTPDLLVLEEIGYLPCDARSAALFYNIISRRHEKRSTVVTTNLAFKQWNTVFSGATCVVALVDRFAQHCHVFDIDADSWRQKTSLKSSPDRANRSR